MNRIVLREKKQLIFFLVSLFFVMTVLLWKAFYGYVFSDEPFMISMGHRIVKGDQLFLHEWNTSQLIGLFFAPFIFIYTSFSGGTEGLILFCRIIYVIWWVVAGIIIYRRLKKYGVISVIAVLMFWMYTPLDEMTLTYNAIGLSLLLVYLSYFLTKGNFFLDGINGLVLALAVLAYPGLILLFFIYSIIVIVYNIINHFSKGKNIKLGLTEALSIKKYLRITCVAAVIFLLFCCFVFFRETKGVFDSILKILSFQSSHKPSIISLFKELITLFPVQIICGFICLIISIFDKSRQKRIRIYLSIQILLYFFSMFAVLTNTYYFNIVLIPFSFIGLQSIVLIKTKPYVIILFFYIFGIFVAFCWYFSSDTGLMAFSNGLLITNISSIVCLYLLYSEAKDKMLPSNIVKYIMVAGFSLVLSVQIGSELFIKVQRTYWDELFPSLNTSINVGASKNIITTESNAKEYTAIYEDVQKIKRLTDFDSSKKFLSLSLLPFIYLDLDYEYACFSTWTYSNNNNDFDIVNNKLEMYYDTNPEKRPDIIYINIEDNACLDQIKCIDLNNYVETKIKTGRVFVINKD